MEYIYITKAARLMPKFPDRVYVNCNKLTLNGKTYSLDNLPEKITLRVISEKKSDTFLCFGGQSRHPSTEQLLFSFFNIKAFFLCKLRASILTCKGS